LLADRGMLFTPHETPGITRCSPASANASVNKTGSNQDPDPKAILLKVRHVRLKREACLFKRQDRGIPSTDWLQAETDCQEMIASLDLARELSQRNAVPFASIPGAFTFTDETPAHRFANVVAPIFNGEYCVVLSSRDYFDESLAAAVIDFVVKRASSLSAERPLVLLDGFTCPQYSFNAVAVLSPAAANRFEHENDVLNERAFVVFPIYRCELSGDESPELVDSIRHGLLASLDWKRSPCPKVTMAYRNRKNKAGSRPRLTTLDTVLHEVDELYDSEGSWIELHNYAGHRCRIVWSHGQYTVEFPELEATTLDKAALVDSINLFLTHGQE
ncbi:MAG: hypothetical protein MN733_33140, partial [Nitrososphaera sp.]|nr:hypothetical protein [Nitrososphaera sp.]